MNFIYSELDKAYIQLIYKIEFNQSFESFFISENEDIVIQRKIWLQNFEEFKIELNQRRFQTTDSSNRIEKYNFILNFPFSKLEYGRIEKIFNEVSSVQNTIEQKAKYADELAD